MRARCARDVVRRPGCRRRCSCHRVADRNADGVYRLPGLVRLRSPVRSATRARRRVPTACSTLLSTNSTVVLTDAGQPAIRCRPLRRPRGSPRTRWLPSATDSVTPGRALAELTRGRPKTCHDLILRLMKTAVSPGRFRRFLTAAASIYLGRARALCSTATLSVGGRTDAQRLSGHYAARCDANRQMRELFGLHGRGPPRARDRPGLETRTDPQAGALSPPLRGPPAPRSRRMASGRERVCGY